MSMSRAPSVPESPPIVVSSSAGLIEKAIEVVTSLTLQNVLTVALLAVIATPSWFAWRFMQDVDFRREFMTSTEVVDMKVPCLVVLTNLHGQNHYGVSRAYKWEDRLEYRVSIVSKGMLPDAEVRDACTLVSEEIQRVRAIVSASQITAQALIKP